MTTYFSDQAWKQLPLALRQRWWDETDYGRKEPSAELLAAIAAALEKRNAASQHEQS